MKTKTCPEKINDGNKRTTAGETAHHFLSVGTRPNHEIGTSY
jgi:hypothetical protein